MNDALAPLGALISDQPTTPERVFRALGRVWPAGADAPGAASVTDP